MSVAKYGNNQAKTTNTGGNTSYLLVDMQILNRCKFLGTFNYKILVLSLSVLGILLLAPMANASYAIKNLNVTVTLNQNTSAQVTEILQVTISNASVSQYSTNRVALNLTLSEWQSIIGTQLEQHIISPNSSVYNFKFLPGPVTKENGQSMANIILAYGVSNVTFINETAPRIFQYRFNPRVFNFAHGVSGEVLSQNTTLTMVLPQGSEIISVYPIPDLPVFAFSNGYKNITTISWLFGEPLSKFTLVFTIRQSLQAEVEGFFSKIYQTLGIFTYIIIAGAVMFFILYIYQRASK